MEELGDEEYWSSDYEDSKLYESEGKLRSIWRKGVDFGKKMVVTSVVVSSAPFVLPPLMALSAIGFAFSLPAGFMIASYACTDKLMNTLLPIPSQPPYLEPGTLSSDEEEYGDGDEVDKGYEEEEDDDDIAAEEKGSEEDTRHVTEMTRNLVEECYNDTSGDPDELPVHKDESDTTMRMSGAVEEGGYEEDVGEYMETEDQNLDSNAIPRIMEGIREAESEISLMESEGVELPKDSLRAFVMEAEVGGENETEVERVSEDLAFVLPRDEGQQNGNKGDFADIEEDELKHETTGLLQQIRDEGRDDHSQKHSRVQGKRKEDEQNGKIPIKDPSQERGDKNLFVIPEEVKPAGIVGTEDLDATVGVSGEGESKTRIEQEQAELVIERTLVVNVKKAGEHTATDVHQATGSDNKLGTLIFSTVDVMEVADESRLGDRTEVPDQLADSLKKMPEGEESASDSAIDVSIDYHEVRVEAVAMPEHAEKQLNQDQSAVSSDKEFIDEGKIWKQIHAMRTIVGYKTAPHASCVEELNALYAFTGVEPPISSEDALDLAGVDEKLRFLMSIIGVK